ncbi:MAG TPA: rhamnogalacturonan acetylesterase [Niabella sp.]|jgi:lysophospholipase L1-like esterase|nr:rhamnogalacturonan acetylesterase [Niabella sp.]HUN03621.1 rhamnogalacturonan acetylesterase [Niabella sp.]
MMKSAALIISGLLFLSFMTFQNKKTKIFLAGDSTMAIKDTRAYPETGWGMPFVYFWDSTVQVVNLAKNGWSTKSFISEGLWNQILNNVETDDYVFIQFGHNDEVSTKKTYTTEIEFKTNLTKFVTEARAKGAQPVLLTPVARRKFDLSGKIEGTHEVYSQIVRDVAMLEKVPLIDLDKKAQELYQQLGDENSKLLFMHLKPGEHPNYPKGKIDDTHFNELGARLIAEIVWKDIKTQLPQLAARASKKS